MGRSVMSSSSSWIRCSSRSKRSEEHTSELQSQSNLVCRLLLEKKKISYTNSYYYIGHFSKFIRPGASRTDVAPNRSMVLTTGVVKPNGILAIAVVKHTGHEGD